MADIHHDFPIQAPIERVFEAISTPRGLDAWWTRRARGRPEEGAEYELWFGPEYDWRAVVAQCTAPTVFELRMTASEPDWTGTRVGFELERRGDRTWVRFRHTGWPHPNEHWRVSCYCWAMYLRILRRYVEHGEHVAYEARLDA
jgi:uncharacterized protein YndB with AHSA1/START domain